MSYLLETASPLVLGAGRFSLAALVSLIWCVYSYKNKITLKHAIRFLIAGFIGIFLYNVFLNYGQQSVSAGASSFIVNCNPLFTALIGFFILKQKVTIIHWLGITFCLLGVSIISIDQEGGLELGSGATLILFAATLTATYFHILKPLVLIYGAITSAAYTILFGTIPMFFWFPEMFGFVINSTNEVRIAFLWLALFPTTIGYLTWTYTVGHYGANKASLFLYLIPPISILLDFIWYNNIPSLYTILGGLIIILSVSLTLFLQNKKIKYNF
jgi:drug/metabolite transporter (DMT)-like permease